MILYHITPAKNLNSILKQGLIPNAGKGLTSDQKRKYIWLTDKPDYVLTQQAGTEWIKRFKPYILTVNIEPYREQLKAYITWAWDIPKVCPHEFFIESSISSLDITNIEEVIL
jgi:hypothetical protein